MSHAPLEPTAAPFDAPLPFGSFEEALRAVMEQLSSSGAVSQWVVFRTCPERDANVVLDVSAERPLVLRQGDVVPWSSSFCRRIIEDDVRTVPDAPADPAFAHLPFVASGRMAAYVGVPIRMADGEAFGTLCGFDSETRAPAELEAVVPVLDLYARLLATLVDQQRRADDAEAVADVVRDAATRDQLTGLGNHARWHTAMEAHRGRRAIGVLMADLDDFKAINDTHGHVRGDQVLAEVADVLRAASRPTDELFRLGGDEFAVLLPGCDRQRTSAACDRLRAALGEAGIAVSVGAAHRIGDEGLEDLRELADAAMYRQKERRRSVNVEALHPMLARRADAREAITAHRV